MLMNKMLIKEFSTVKIGRGVDVILKIAKIKENQKNHRLFSNDTEKDNLE